MERFQKHLRIGRRWLVNGWRLFRRNPWLLSGMGLTAAVVLGLLEMIPLGGLLVALAAPIFLSSAYLALETTHRQNLELPAELRLAALTQSPQQILSVFRDESRIIPMVSASLYSVSAVLLIHLLQRLIAGEAWVATWSNLDALSLLGVILLAVIAVGGYVLLAASLIYALPLSLFRHEPLMLSLRKSLKASRHFMVALMLLLAMLALPLVISGLFAGLAVWLGYLFWVVTGTVILPVVAAGLYCSYCDIFDTRDAWEPADRRRDPVTQGTDTHSPDSR